MKVLENEFEGERRDQDYWHQPSRDQSRESWKDQSIRYVAQPQPRYPKQDQREQTILSYESGQSFPRDVIEREFKEIEERYRYLDER